MNFVKIYFIIFTFSQWNRTTMNWKPYARQQNTCIRDWNNGVSFLPVEKNLKRGEKEEMNTFARCPIFRPLSSSPRRCHGIFSFRFFHKSASDLAPNNPSSAILSFYSKSAKIFATQGWQVISEKKNLTENFTYLVTNPYWFVYPGDEYIMLGPL